MPSRVLKGAETVNAELIVFVIYLFFMLGIGVFFFLRTRNGNEKDYFLGGRKMGPWVSALSAGASDMSAWVLMGLPASVYAFGVGQTWIAIGLAIGYALSWIFEARRLRRMRLSAFHPKDTRDEVTCYVVEQDGTTWQVLLTTKTKTVVYLRYTDPDRLPGFAPQPIQGLIIDS